MVDLHPTLAALCSLPAPDYLHGTSLRPVLDDANATVKEAAFSQVRRGQNGEDYSVRSGPWRYTEWTNATGQLTATQLFDEVADPAETKNLASDPAHAATVKALAALLVPIRAQKQSSVSPRNFRPARCLRFVILTNPQTKPKNP